jgi:iron(III) transport system substrate-binding protein
MRRQALAILVVAGVAVLAFRGCRTPAPPTGWTIIRPPHNTAALAIQGSIVWVGGEDGLVAIDRHTGAVMPARAGQPPFADIRDLLVSRDGELWVAHRAGLTRHAGERWHTLGPEDGLAAGPYLALCEDRRGDVWIGREGSLMRYDGHAPPTVFAGDSLPVSQVDTVFEDQNGAIWAGSASPVAGGLACLERGAWRTYSTRDGLVHNSINQITQGRDGALWVAAGFASRGGASRLLDGRWTKVTRQDGLAGEKVRSIFEDRNGRFWFGSEYDGLAIRDRNRWSVSTPKTGLAGWEVRDIVQDPDGVIWLATENGVSRIAQLDGASPQTGQAASGPARSVVVYTSVDQVYSEPILRRFERQTGIRVLPVYDVEATRTTGLVNRLLAEKIRPQADVFWSGEFAQTLSLKEGGALAPYQSASAADIPAAYRDPDGYWTGFAGRARVLLVNTRLLPPSRYPDSLLDVLDPSYPADRVGMALPLFGTAATHAATLYAAWGHAAGQRFFANVRARGVRIVDGNSVVRDMVADGRLLFGVTDSDDACGAVARGAPVRVIVPDQGAGGFGALVIPNTVARVAAAPHPAEAAALIDHLLQRDVEASLVAAGWSHVPVRPPGVRPNCVDGTALLRTNVALNAVSAQRRLAARDLTEMFLR